jgi:hypothetical protein
MLLNRLKVLLQTVQENCVEPTRISAEEGIQYWLGGTCWLPATGGTVVTVDDSAGAAAKKPAAALLLRGGAMDSEMLTSGSWCCCSWNRKLP